MALNFGVSICITLLALFAGNNNGRDDCAVIAFVSRHVTDTTTIKRDSNFDLNIRSWATRLGEIGGARRDRTADLYNAIVALSQLSYGPVVDADNLSQQDLACQVLAVH